MTIRLIGCAPLVGLCLFFALPALAEDAPQTTATPGAPAAEPAPVEIPTPDAPPPTEEAAPVAPDAMPAPETPEAAPADTPAPAVDQPPEAAPDVDAAPDAAPAEEPVPDAPPMDASAFLDEVYLTCVSALEDTAGAYDIFTAADWAPQIDEGSETPYYRQIDGSKSYPGIGEASLFYSVEVFPSMSINYCMIAVDAAEQPVPVADLIDRDDLTGLVRRQGDRVFSMFESDDDDPLLFIQAEQNDDTGGFVLDATYNDWTDGADLPPAEASDWDDE